MSIAGLSCTRAAGVRGDNGLCRKAEGTCLSEATPIHVDPASTIQPMISALQVAALMGHYGALKSRVASYHSQLLAALEPASEMPAEIAVV